MRSAVTMHVPNSLKAKDRGSGFREVCWLAQAAQLNQCTIVLRRLKTEGG